MFEKNVTKMKQLLSFSAWQLWISHVAVLLWKPCWFKI